jgi:hypothetical protein
MEKAAVFYIIIIREISHFPVETSSGFWADEGF